MKKIINIALDLLFPPRCAICEEVVVIGSALCDDCIEKLRHRFDNIALCSHCGKPAKSCICSYGLCFSGCVTAFEYCDETAKLFKILKNDADSPAAAQLAELMVEKFYQSDISQLHFDFITYVPSSAGTVEKKGFDHSARLAQEVSTRISIPYIDPPVMRKDDSTAQHTLKKRERYINAEKSYLQIEGVGISGRILLVDDIITTGATLDRCADVLIKCGAKEVYCLTAASTLLNNE